MGYLLSSRARQKARVAVQLMLRMLRMMMMVVMMGMKMMMGLGMMMYYGCRNCRRWKKAHFCTWQ